MTIRNGDRTLMATAALLLLAGCAARPSDPDALNNQYQQSIAAAAVKRPDYARPLRPIDKSRAQITVAHLQPNPNLDTKHHVWVALPDELHALCRGRPDPLLAMQQALGLPPIARDDVRVFTFDVRPTDMFRPCASSPDISARNCTVDLPEELTGAQAAAEHFVLKQMMDSYRSGFAGPGYPFTAMGWSYDWNPQSQTHQGVSEYVVNPGAVVSNIASVDPKTFCRAQ